MELKDLKHNLKVALKKSGAVDSVVAQMRKEFISSMHNSHPNVTSVSIGQTLEDKLIHSIIYHTLKNRNMSHSLSVFSAEVGFDSFSQNSNKLTEFDIVNYLSISGIDTAMFEKDKENFRSKIGVLEMIISAVGVRKQNGTCEISIQTDDELGHSPSINQFYHIKQSLNDHLKEIRSTYAIRRDLEKELPSITIEERMIQLSNTIRSDCEVKFRNDHELLLVQLANEQSKYAALQAKYNDLCNARGELSQRYEEDRQNLLFQVASEKNKGNLLQSKLDAYVVEMNEVKCSLEDDKKILTSQLTTEKARVHALQSKYTDTVNITTEQSIRYEEDRQNHILQLKSEKSKHSLLQGQYQETLNDLNKVSHELEQCKTAQEKELQAERIKYVLLERQLNELKDIPDRQVNSGASKDATARRSDGPINHSTTETVVIPRVKYNKLLQRCKELEGVVKDQQQAINNFIKAQQKHQLMRQLSHANEADLRVHIQQGVQQGYPYSMNAGGVDAPVGYSAMPPPVVQYVQYPPMMAQPTVPVLVAQTSSTVGQPIAAAQASLSAATSVTASGPSPNQELSAQLLQREQDLQRQQQLYEQQKETESLRRQLMEQELSAMRQKEVDRVRSAELAQIAASERELAEYRKQQQEKTAREESQRVADQLSALAVAKQQELDRLHQVELQRVAREKELELERVKRELDSVKATIITAPSVTLPMAVVAAEPVLVRSFTSRSVRDSFAPDSDDDSPSDESSLHSTPSSTNTAPVSSAPVTDLPKLEQQPLPGAWTDSSASNSDADESMDRADAVPVHPPRRSNEVDTVATTTTNQLIPTPLSASEQLADGRGHSMLSSITHLPPSVMSSLTSQKSMRFDPDSDDDSPSDENSLHESDCDSNISGYKPTDKDSGDHISTIEPVVVAAPTFNNVNSTTTSNAMDRSMDSDDDSLNESQIAAQQREKEQAARDLALEIQMREAEEDAQRRRKVLEERRQQEQLQREEQMRLAELERQRVQELEKERLAQVERERLDAEEMKRLQQEEIVRQRIAEQDRLRELERQRVLEAEAQHAEEHRLELQAQAEEEAKKKQQEDEDNNAIAEARRKVLERRNKLKSSTDSGLGSGTVISSSNFDQANNNTSVMSSMSNGSLTGGQWTQVQGSYDSMTRDSLNNNNNNRFSRDSQDMDNIDDMYDDEDANYHSRSNSNSHAINSNSNNRYGGRSVSPGAQQRGNPVSTYDNFGQSDEEEESVEMEYGHNISTEAYQLDDVSSEEDPW